MAKVTCVATYAEGDVVFEAGKSYDFPEEEAARLVRGAPSSWEYDPAQVRVGGPAKRVNYHEERSQDRIGSHPPSPPSPAQAGEGAGAGDDGGDGDVDLDEMKVAELKAYAQERGIDLTGAKSKVEIVAAIERAEALGSNDDADDEDDAEGGEDDPGDPGDDAGTGDDAGDDDEE